MSQVTFQPLAARMRPQKLEQFIGQSHLLGPNKAMRQALDRGQLHSMIFWGPPGTGKTTLANLIAEHLGIKFDSLSAVLDGVKDVRLAVARAQEALQDGHATLLFIDEVHRFNKSQQDAFLPFVENGTITLIGATTENPSFALNNALLSRSRVYIFKSHTQEDLVALLEQALNDTVRGLGALQLQLTSKQLEQIARAADGDGRRALNLLEMLADFSTEHQGHQIIEDQALAEVLSGHVRRFDKQGDDFYDLISALHKSIRGSDPDAALYWLARMLDGGCDPRYLARRLVRIASEDIGNADPRALAMTLDAWEVQERLGKPEGELALAQAAVYMACCAKSNAVYTAFAQAMADVEQHGSLPVPLHLRNAPTKLMKESGYGKDYRYAHNEDNGFAAGEHYLPEGLTNRRYYEPVERGLEIKIKAKLAALRELNNSSKVVS